MVRIRKPNLFDKQELFEIEEHFNNNHANPEKLELFPTNELKLQIPVSNSFIKALNSLPDDESPQLQKDTISLEPLENPESPKPPKPFFYLPGVVDLSFWCSAVEDQGTLNSCAAFAGSALLEYFVNRSSGEYTDVSPLFLYKAARNKMNVTEGDVGASIRETMKAMALFGIPPEESWPYEEEKVDEEPPPFCYAYAQNYQALKYFRLDYAGISKEILLFQIKAVLAAGFPCMFGFTIYTSAYDDSNSEKGE